MYKIRLILVISSTILYPDEITKEIGLIPTFKCKKKQLCGSMRVANDYNLWKYEFDVSGEKSTDNKLRDAISMLGDSLEGIQRLLNSCSIIFEIVVYNNQGYPDFYLPSDLILKISSFGFDVDIDILR